MCRVYTNGPGDQGSILGRVIPKTKKKKKKKKKKRVIGGALLNTQHYKVRIKGKVEQSTTLQCSSNWKESLWVTLDYGRQLYFYLLTSV